MSQVLSVEVDMPVQRLHESAASTVVMVRPARFGFNEEAAEDNAFMRPAARLSQNEIEVRARHEFDGMVTALRAAGVEVLVVEDSDEPRKPDAVFPNNWFSTHADGTFITYPMLPTARRLERFNPVLDTLRQAFTVSRTIALEHAEDEGHYLEGTGSLVLDRRAQIAYACVSQRTHPALIKRWSELMGYELVSFDAADTQGVPFYHTNVMLAVGKTEAIVCAESIPESQRTRVLNKLRDTGRQLIEISQAQVLKFCGNALEVLDADGQLHWVVSNQAYAGFTDEQRALLEQRQPIIYSSLEAIEQLGGGSARCMIAEVFLPLASTPPA